LSENPLSNWRRLVHRKAAASLKSGGLCLFSLLSLSALPAAAAPCGETAAGFPAWLSAFREEAGGDGLSPRVVDSALGDVAYDRAMISRDRSQGVFRLSFEKFSARLVTPSRLARGRSLLQGNAGLLREIESRYGVPGPVLVSIWGLETGYGADNGHFKTLQALATLAYDCRRSPQFTDELKDALKIVARGDMTPAQMRGDWAGEIGQTQFMPSSYLAYAVDFDGDGRRDLIHSKADALASTANFLKGKGWRAGAGWAEGEANFPVFLEWNKSNVYARTLAYFATRLAEGR
jgi:lytic murein transglycosylase